MPQEPPGGGRDSFGSGLGWPKYFYPGWWQRPGFARAPGFDHRAGLAWKDCNKKFSMPSPASGAAREFDRLAGAGDVYCHVGGGGAGRGSSSPRSPEVPVANHHARCAKVSSRRGAHYDGPVRASLRPVEITAHERSSLGLGSRPHVTRIGSGRGTSHRGPAGLKGNQQEVALRGNQTPPTAPAAVAAESRFHPWAATTPRLRTAPASTSNGGDQLAKMGHPRTPRGAALNG